MDKKLAYKIAETYFESGIAAVAYANDNSIRIKDIETIEIEPHEVIVAGRIATKVQEPQIQYKVLCDGQEIPFWENFEGAKACVLAINTNKQGNRARLTSFQGVGL